MNSDDSADKDLLISATGTYKIIRDPLDKKRKDGQLPVALGIRDAAMLESVLKAVDKAAQEREATTLSLPQSASTPASVLSVRPAREEGWAVVSLKSLEGELPLPDPRILIELFSLTPTESQTALDLLRHEELADIAAARNCSIETVRMHVKNLLRKTGAPSQKRLTALLTRIAAVAALKRSDGD
jgi:DNA-binding CsgD family transcriptional regulator